MKTIKCLLLVCLMLLVTTSQVLAANLNQPSLSAETLLGNLAQAKKTERIIGGVTLTALGIGTGVLVSTIKSGEDLNKEDVDVLKTVGYWGAGIMIGSGVIILALPSEAENHYKDVKTINDPAARENAAYSSLVFCAEKARTERLVSGTISAGAALYYLFAEPNYYSEENYNKYSGLMFAAAAASSFFIRSAEEKILDQYERGQGYSAAEGQHRPSFRMGWLPNGCVTAVYSYQF